MGALLSLPITLLNFLLPFTKPGTPILQDLIHTVVLCGTLYFAPQIAEWYNTQQLASAPPGDEQTLQPPPEGQQTQQRVEAHENLQPAAADARAPFQPQIEDEAEQPHPQPGPAQEAHEPAQAPFVPADGDPGPAFPNNAAERPRPTPANRAIGAKKAKSLARKDQRRAYHEFHRQEAELRRLADAEGKEEREAALAAEKARRAAAEAEIAERERKEREEVKREREREADEEAERRERVVGIVREEVESRGAVDLEGVAGREGRGRKWIERVVRASGVLGALEREAEGKVVVTSRGWVVRVDRGLMEEAYREAEVYGEERDGIVDFEAFGEMLERAVRKRGGL